MATSQILLYQQKKQTFETSLLTFPSAAQLVSSLSLAVEGAARLPFQNMSGNFQIRPSKHTALHMTLNSEPCACVCVCGVEVRVCVCYLGVSLH